MAKRGRPKTEDKLSAKVEEYQKTNDQILLSEICSLSEGLIYGVMNYYFMHYFPLTIQDEVIEDCKSLVILRAIEGFDRSKARFSTYYTWKLKSHIRGKKQCLMRRKEILAAKRLDAPIRGCDEITPLDNLTTFDYNVKVRVKRGINTIFNI